MRVLICSNPSRDVGGAIAEKVSNILRNYGVNSTRCEILDVDVLANAECDLLLTLGGDGTILHTAPYAVEREIPVLGVNLGSVGHLCAFGRGELEVMLERIVRGEYITEYRSVLNVRQRIVINEVVLYRGLYPRPIRVIAKIYGEDYEITRNIRGDGVIIATSTGSTAYSKFAGGQILEPTSDFVQVTPICAVDSPPEVLRQFDHIELAYECEGQAVISIDGKDSEPIAVGESVVI
ncbi:MAG: NAD(+)/NADH kinase, partial [Oscillospiraceae bacterium]|nr:NAD(+)/NADH kinase [Oscillospiraceae bacterium]